MGLERKHLAGLDAEMHAFVAPAGGHIFYPCADCGDSAFDDVHLVEGAMPRRPGLRCYRCGAWIGSSDEPDIRPNGVKHADLAQCDRLIAIGERLGVYDQDGD